VGHSRRLAATTAAIAILLLGGCASSPDVITGSSVTVGVETQFSSYNIATVLGNSPTNAGIVAATNSAFTYYDNSGALVLDKSFGHYRKISDNPLVVQYTVADGVTWSDGTAIDAADLLLAWVAGSGAYDTTGLNIGDYRDPLSGRFTADLPGDAVYFDSAADPLHPAGLALVTALPRMSDDRKSITLTYDRQFAGWETAFYSAAAPALPAHVVAKGALGISDVQAAKDAVIRAITDRDTAALASISHFWNTGFTVSDTANTALLVGSGPYLISRVTPGESVELTANARYSGAHPAGFQHVRVLYISNPLAAVQALSSEEVQVIAPAVTLDIVNAYQGSGQSVVTGVGSRFERLDLRVSGSKSGKFDDPRIRQAFLKTVPRQSILDSIIVPLAKDAALRDSLTLAPGATGYADSVAGNGSSAFAKVDIEGAKALLAQAGVGSAEVCVLYDSSDARRVAEFALVKASAALAGFTVTDCGSANWKAVLGTAGAYDAVLSSVVPDAAAYGTGAPGNLVAYSNADVDGLVGSLDGTADPSARATILAMIDRLLFADFASLPLYSEPVMVAYDSRVVRNVTAPASGMPWDVWDWRPAPSGS
jgi:peptide/nickel transport system substrate-binding protein